MSKERKRSHPNRQRGLKVLWHEGVAERRSGDVACRLQPSGHTAMSADMDHQAISQGLKTTNTVENFEDFENVVASTGLFSNQTNERD